MYVWLSAWPSIFRSLFTYHLLKEAYSGHLTETCNPALSLPFSLNSFLFSLSITQHIWQTICFNYLLDYCLFLQSSTRGGIFFLFYLVLSPHRQEQCLTHRRFPKNICQINEWMSGIKKLASGCQGESPCCYYCFWREEHYPYKDAKLYKHFSNGFCKQGADWQTVFPVPPSRPGSTSAYF